MLYKEIGEYELNQILEKHSKWVHQEEGGERANLHGVDLSCTTFNLSGADLSGADLSEADLNGANLIGANLIGANLIGANLIGADLSEADLNGANLIGADLYGADLGGADLSEADLIGANLIGANLYGAGLSGADLGGADLSEANLIGANLSGANLILANLYDTCLPKCEMIRRGIKLSSPLIGYKKCSDNVIVKLEIPVGAIVFSINNKKCRTDRAKVVEIYGDDLARSMYDPNFIYRVGDELEVFDFNLEYNVECGAGIHFFLTKEEAENFCEYN